MKKFTAAVMLAVLMVTSVPVWGASGELSVGSTTKIAGQFFTDRFGNAASDLDVRSLIHGYDLICWDSEKGAFITDPSVVSGMVVTENAAGDRTHKITLYENLKYSDGTAITAKDYAFSILLSLHPLMEKLGAEPSRTMYLKGASDFVSGKSKVLTGVRLLGKYELSVIVDHSYLPFFYELGLLDFTPSPMHVLAPGCDVKDDGKGISLTGNLTEETLRRTIFDEQSGYMSHPSVVSGPYKLDSFDGETAVFSVNENYKGNRDGQKPAIGKVKYGLVNNSDMISRLTDGTFDLINKTADKDAAQEGMKLASQNDAFSMTNYPRSGLSFISFGAEKGPVKSLRVRQAIAWCMDRSALSQGYEGNLGTPVSGWYGIGQWMFREVQKGNAIEGVETYDAGSAEANLKRAEDLLSADGWTLNREGGTYTAGTDEVRCRNAGSGLEELTLTLHYPEGSRIGALLEEHLAKPLAEAGILLQVEGVSPEQILAEYYGKEEGADMVFLASNFDIVFDAAAEFRRDSSGKLSFGGRGVADDALYKAAVDLRKTKPGEKEAYCKKWVTFQKEFARVLPVIPVYSNVYIDFYTTALRDYHPEQYTTWTEAIIGAYVNESPEPETADAQNASSGTEPVIEFEG